MSSAHPSGGVGAALDLDADVLDLTRTVCDLESVSGNEGRLADAVETALRRLPHLEVLRDGDAVLARTALGRPERVVLAGHLDTVPVAGNLPTRLEGGAESGVLVGRGTADMKGGVAVQLKVASALAAPSRDITFVFYDNEEVDADRNGLGRLARNHADWLAGDLAVLLEPTAGGIEGGCNGTLKAEVVTRGVAAHSARWWRGVNAIHEAGRVLARLQAYQPREVEVEGLVFREGLNAVSIGGGIAGNVIPDVCRVVVNYRFAPDKDLASASGHVREVFEGYEVNIVDGADGARPGLDRPAAAAFAAAIGAAPSAKYGWTDVARFSALGIPALNFGPGDPSVAHADDEHVPVAHLRACERALLTWLS
jgi:succinyl-diaminopimelate desuccinylase